MTTAHEYFAAQHAERVGVLAQKMFEAFIKDDAGAFTGKTGKLVRSSTLRTKKTKRQVSLLLDSKHVGVNNAGEQRFWSKSVVSNALKKMVKEHAVQVPQLPGFSWSDWYAEQAALVQSLCKKATRNSRGNKLVKMGSMDSQPTLDYDPAAAEDCFANLFSR